MIKLQCPQCSKAILTTQRNCPHCGAHVVLWRALKKQVEAYKLYQAGTIIVLLLLVGFGWFARMSTGLRWPLYVAILIALPLIPWLLTLAYKNASPPSDEKP